MLILKMRKSLSIFIILSIFILIIFLLFNLFPPVIQTEPFVKMGEQIFKCNKDEDCISVVNEVYICGEPEFYIAINKNYVKYWENIRTNPVHPGCVETIKSLMPDLTYYGKPRCVKNRCELTLGPFFYFSKNYRNS
jgi:hypothetical protein